MLRPPSAFGITVRNVASRLLAGRAAQTGAITSDPHRTLFRFGGALALCAPASQVLFPGTTAEAPDFICAVGRARTILLRSSPLPLKRSRNGAQRPTTGYLGNVLKTMAKEAVVWRYRRADSRLPLAPGCLPRSDAEVRRASSYNGISWECTENKREEIETGCFCAPARQPLWQCGAVPVLMPRVSREGLARLRFA